MGAGGTVRAIVELRQLRVFVAIVEELSFTRAADRLHVVQSAVSASLRTLEAELGAILIDRRTTPMTLSDAGEALLVEARRTLAAADAAIAAVDQVRGGLRGTVQIGVMQGRSLGGGGHTLPAVLEVFYREHPAVAVKVRHTGGSREMAGHVRDGTLDLAFVALAEPDPAGLVLLPLGHEPLALICNANHPVAGGGPVRLSDLRDETFADVPVGWGTRTLVDAAFATARVERSVRYEINDVAVMLEFATQDLAVTLLPASFAASAPETTAVALVDAPIMTTSLASPVGRPVSAAAAALTKTIAELFS